MKTKETQKLQEKMQDLKPLLEEIAGKELELAITVCTAEDGIALVIHTRMKSDKTYDELHKNMIASLARVTETYAHDEAQKGDLCASIIATALQAAFNEIDKLHEEVTNTETETVH